MPHHHRRATRAASLLSLAIGTALFGAAQGHEVLSVQAHTARVLLPRGVYTRNDVGATLLHDYGAFQLWRVDSAHAAELDSAGGLAKAQNDLIEFEAAPFTPAAGLPQIPEAFRAAKTEGLALRLIQFVGPVADEWLAAVAATGATPVQYLPNNAYLVLADANATRGLDALAHAGDVVQYSADLEPYFKLDRAIARRAQNGLVAGRPIDLTVAIASHGGSAATKSRVQAFAHGAPVRGWSDLRGMEAITIKADEGDLAKIAQIPDVIALEEHFEPRKLDEVQAQIIAGNLTADRTGPSATGYLTWLTAHGFSTNPADYPMVDVADDGLGTGDAATAAGDLTLRRDGNVANASRVLIINNCTPDANGGGTAGHGHINTNIVGGYDARSGLPFADPNGYLRGQGISPYVRLGHTKIFTDAGGYDVSNCSNTDAGVIKKQQDGGAVISSNSWGAGVAVGSSGDEYESSARAYDIGTRDADLTEAGNQPMIFVFAAGNDGPTTDSVGTPGSAKNVITVGASENKRPSDESGTWTDGCGIGSSGADNAMDVISFSSRGPVEGGRVKPEVIAPGTHIQGTASTNAGYTGGGVCDKYRPTGQTTFAASSGTSHSTPAIAGVTSLVYRFLQTQYADAAPSAAAIKAYLMAHPTYLTGVSANDNLPSNNQGFGMPNLTLAFDSTTARVVEDQTTVLGATGDTYTWTGSVADTGKPLRVAIAYSDAPGALTGNPAVNNLNLTVQVNGQTYLGNHFTGQYSTTGGSADAANNYEAVFLPAGTSGPMTVTVTAANIAGDGVPGNADTTDQDFAFVCSNCSSAPDFTVDATPAIQSVCAGTNATFDVALAALNGFASSVALSQTGVPGGATSSFTPPALVPTGNSSFAIGTSGVADGSYPITVSGTGASKTHVDSVTLNVSAAIPTGPALSAPADNATGAALAPALSWAAVAGTVSYTVEVDDDPLFASINYTATVSGTSHTIATPLNPNTKYYWRVRATNGCGATNSAAFSFTTVNLVCQTFTSTDVPKAIGPNIGQNAVSTLTSALTGTINDVDVVNLNGTHTWINDISVSLKSPDNTTVSVMDRSCASQDNFALNLDDAAAGNAGGWPCPPIGGGTYKPSNPLSAFNGGLPNGTWTLTVADNANADGGNLNGWGLRICATQAPTSVDAVADAFSATEDTTLNQAAPGVLSNDIGSGLTLAVVTPPTHGNLVLNQNGSFSFAPTADYCGPDSFVYSITNGTTTDQATANLSVACVNDAPTAAADSYTVNEDTPLNQAAPGVLANDTDVDSATLTAGGATTPTKGIVSLATNGSFVYTPNANACGNDSFTYKANDGALDSTAVTVSIAITCINDPPAAVGSVSAQSFTERQGVNLPLAAFFSEPEGETMTFSVTGVPASLTINPSTGVLSGTLADGDAAGSVYTVVVTAKDPSNATATQTFSLTVLPFIDAVFKDGFE